MRPFCYPNKKKQAPCKQKHLPGERNILFSLNFYYEDMITNHKQDEICKYVAGNYDRYAYKRKNQDALILIPSAFVKRMTEGHTTSFSKDDLHGGALVQVMLYRMDCGLLGRGNAARG